MDLNEFTASSREEIAVTDGSGALVVTGHIVAARLGREKKPSTKKIVWRFNNLRSYTLAEANALMVEINKADQLFNEQVASGER